MALASGLSSTRRLGTIRIEVDGVDHKGVDLPLFCRCVQTPVALGPVESHAEVVRRDWYCMWTTRPS